jgi:ABC-type polysaccharide/polyol phosphate transport system ATPase subunit
MSSRSAPDAETAFSFSHVSKVYRHYANPRDRFFEAITGKPRHVAVRALDDVSGGTTKGRVLGLIGENGSGKSTLFKILAGTTPATAGEVAVTGRVASILELGSAFHPDDTGRRNVVLQAALSGLSKSEVETALPEIESFADLGDFFDRPVKTYSSGMVMRLAFSVATAVVPDVILLDEALAVGDGRFQKKCVDRIFDLKASGRTIFFCSHAMYYVSTLCDDAVWLDKGRVAASGDAQSVVLEYEKFLAKKAQVQVPAAHVPAHEGTHGKLLEVRVIGADGSSKEEFRPGEPWGVELEFAADAKERPIQIHLAVSTRDNVVCFSADSRLDGSGPFVGKERYVVRVLLDALPLGKGEFVVYAYLADENALALYDSRSDRTFHVESETWRSGLLSVRSRWEEVAAD